MPVKVWDLLLRAVLDADGEIQQADALHLLLWIEKIEAYHLQVKSDRCGSKMGELNAVAEYALQDKKLSNEFSNYLKSLYL